jgi:Zn-finger nucleic acid-binding protein
VSCPPCCGIKRTLDGAEIDKIIADVETRKALAVEHRRRADWRRRELAASRFVAEYDHAEAAALPPSEPDRVR